MNTEKIFYVRRHGYEDGPYDIETLIDALSDTRTDTQAEVFCIGWARWRPVATIPEIVDLCAKRRLNPGKPLTAPADFWHRLYLDQKNAVAPDRLSAFRNDAPRTIIDKIKNV